MSVKLVTLIQEKWQKQMKT